MAAGSADPTAAPSGTVVREYRDGDERGILDLFRRVFGVDRSLAHWRWKFSANPAGREITVAVDRDGRIVGQFASLPNLSLVDGCDARLSQLLDHMVDPAAQRRGVYAAMARAFEGRFLAPDARAGYFGFNLAEVLRIQQRIFPFENLHQVGALRLDLQPAADTGASQPALRAGGVSFLRVDRVERFPSAVDRLWARTKARYRTAIVRDSRYLNWRYADGPDVGYVLLLARHRITRDLAGLAVVRLGWPHEPTAALVDWVVPDGSPRVWRVLAREAHALAREADFRLVRAWLPPGSPDRECLAALGYRTEPTQFLANVWNDGRRGQTLDALRAGWHYSMGDTDIF